MSTIFKNYSFLIGFASKDPMEMDYRKTIVVKFPLCVKEYWRTKRDTIKENKEYFEIVCMGDLGINVMKYVRKGKMVMVEGSLRRTLWFLKKVTRSSYDIHAKSVAYIDRPALNKANQSILIEGSICPALTMRDNLLDLLGDELDFVEKDYFVFEDKKSEDKN